jgi:D-serine ammonia-lyase
VEPSSDEALSLVTLVRSSPELKLRILYTHGGHSYDVPPGSIPDIQRVAAQERDSIVALAKRVPGGVEGVITGVGSTPTCSHPPADGLEGISEMHPGNYLLYDVTQMLIGSCTREQIAMRVLTRVVGHYPSRASNPTQPAPAVRTNSLFARTGNTIQIDCGWTGCSQQGKENGFGEIEKYGSSASSNLVITNLKQEAGSVTTIDGSPLNFADYPLGTLMAILPWHSCAASHQHRRIYVTDGGDDIVDTWATVDGW